MPAGDFDYELLGGRGYAGRRRTDPRIAAHVWAALGDASTVINVGAGAGSYEPPDRYVVAVEPSAPMRAQRTAPAVDAVAEVPIPIDCVNGFVEAFYARPEALLDAAVRRAQSAWAFVSPEIVERGLARLRDALAAGEWDARHGHLRAQPEYLGALRVITALA